MARIFLVFDCTCSHYEIKNKLYIKDLNFELKKNILNLSYQKETYQLLDQESIRLGPYVIVFDLAKKETWFLYPLEDECLIGRDDSCDICILSSKVSKKHCRLVQNEDLFVIHDLNSTNGIFVNRKRIKEKTLQGGDEIIIYDVLIYFVEGYLVINKKPKHEVNKVRSQFKKDQSLSLKKGLCRFPQDINSLTVRVEMPIIKEPIKKAGVFASIGSSILILFSSLLSCIALKLFSDIALESIFSTMFTSLSMSVAFFVYGLINRQLTYKSQQRLNKDEEKLYLEYLEQLKTELDEFKEKTAHQIIQDQKIFTGFSKNSFGIYENKELLMAIGMQKNNVIDFEKQDASYLYKMQTLFKKREQFIADYDVQINKNVYFNEFNKLWIQRKWDQSILDMIMMQYSWLNLNHFRKIVFLVHERSEVKRYLDHPAIIKDKRRLIATNSKEIKELSSLIKGLPYIYIVSNEKLIVDIPSEHFSLIYIGNEPSIYPYDRIYKDNLLTIEFSRDKIRSSIEYFYQNKPTYRAGDLHPDFEHDSVCLKVKMGLDDNQEIITIDFSEKAHGPHALVAGTTGSGKSQWLSYLLMMLIVQNSPEYLQYILIDFKGEAFGQAFLKFDHCAGIISNLEENAMNRFVLSMESEIKQRQLLLKKMMSEYPTKLSHIDVYNEIYQDKISHLFVIVDEFAQLKSRFSQHLHSLIEMARIGRSLGIHLILSTQKPLGIVDDQIWANANLKVCLRVNSETDSREILHNDHASKLVEPGEFIMQVQDAERKGKAFYLYEEISNNRDFTIVDSMDHVLYSKNEKKETLFQYLSNQLLKQEKGHHWIVCPDLNTYQKLNEGFLLIDMPQKQSQRIFDFRDPFLIYTKNINQIMQSILSCIQSKNVYLKGFDVYKEYVDEVLDEIGFCIKSSLLKENDFLIIDNLEDFKEVKALQCIVIVIIEQLNFKDISLIKSFTERMTYQINDIESLRYFFDGYPIHQNTQHPQILYEHAVYECVLNKGHPLKKKNKKQILKLENSDRFLLGFDVETKRPVFHKNDKQILFCYEKVEAIEVIERILSQWKKSNDQLTISKQLDETADVYVLKSSTMNLVTFEKIQNKMNLVWVGNDFIEKGFMIKRKFPLFQGELYFWHENEVFNVREVRQNGVDSY